MNYSVFELIIEYWVFDLVIVFQVSKCLISNQIFSVHIGSLFIGI